jgi:hypothetical protein
MAQSRVAILGEVEKSAEFAKLIRSEEDYNVRFFSFSKEDVDWILSGKGTTTLLAIIPRDLDEGAKIVQSLIDSTNLSSVPLILCGVITEKQNKLIQDIFPKFIPLPLHVEKHVLLDTLNDLNDRRESFLGKQGNKIVSIFETDHFFADLLRQDLGGKIFATTARKENLKEKGYLPEDMEAREIFQALEAELPEWAQARIHRLAYINNRIVNALKLHIDNLDLREASVLSTWALCHNGRMDARRDLTLDSSQKYRMDLASHLSETAEEILWDLEREQAASVIKTVSLLMGKNPVPAGSPAFYPASVILATDMVDRIVWQWSLWNPFAARKLLQSLMVGNFEQFPPRVICAVLKMLLEAIEAAPIATYLPRDVLEDETLSRKAEHERSVTLPEGQRRIPIAALAPGMKLARDVYTYEGVQAVERGIKLDPDLIWRIWSLAATRSLRSQPVIFFNNH